MLEPAASTASPFKEVIVQLTSEHWTRNKRALLLASVGQTLTKRGYSLGAELRGQKLASFIQQELKDRIAVFRSPHDPLVLGMVPIEEANAPDLNVLFAPASGEAAHSRGTIFDKGLWVAFSHQLVPGYIRKMQFHPEIRYIDVLTESADSVDGTVIPPESILPVGVMPKAERDAQLQKNIVSWLEANKLEKDLGIARHRDKDILSNSGDSLLSIVLDALDAKERERVALPLDIVAKLLSRKLRRH